MPDALASSLLWVEPNHHSIYPLIYHKTSSHNCLNSFDAIWNNETSQKTIQWHKNVIQKIPVAILVEQYDLRTKPEEESKVKHREKLLHIILDIFRKISDIKTKDIAKEDVESIYGNILTDSFMKCRNIKHPKETT